MQELTCNTCRTAVLVEKFSPSHTSVQWLDDAAATCPRFAELIAAGEALSAIPTCTALRATIEDAARAGQLAVDTVRVEPVRDEYFADQRAGHAARQTRPT